MEVDSQCKLDKLVSKNPAVSDFEKTLDGLKGDGQNLLAEFVDWEVFGPSYSFNEIRMNYAETQKSSLMLTRYPYLVCSIHAENPKKTGLLEQLI